MTRSSRQASGDAAEDLVAARLSTLGWTVLGRQVHVGRGELDIVAVDRGPPARLVVVEVRWRARRDFGLAEETFDGTKRRHVLAAALRLVDAGVMPDGRTLPRLPLRIDLVVVEPPRSRGGPPIVRHHRDVLGA